MTETRQRTQTGIGLAIIAALGALTYYLAEHVPDWAAGTSVASVATAVEYPVYAIGLGLIGNMVLTKTRLRDRFAKAFNTEIFIKTGLVLLGATINLMIIVRAAVPAIGQAVLLITSVFFFTWWLAGRLGIDDKLRALLASAVSICGVSAAISAAGAVQAKKEQLAYAASIVIAFALPSIFLLPWLADLLGLSPAVAGAWIGGNIDTTAAVTAAGTLVGDDALTIAAIVKTTQNVLIGVVAFALTAYFALRVERAASPSDDGASGAAPSSPAARPRLAVLWQRFPKFVLGFVLASVLVTAYAEIGDAAVAADVVDTAKLLSTIFFILAFVSIGLGFTVSAVREAGWRPVVVFGAATIFNLVVGLALANLFFVNFTP